MTTTHIPALSAILQRLVTPPTSRNATGQETQREPSGEGIRLRSARAVLPPAAKWFPASNHFIPWPRAYSHSVVPGGLEVMS